MIASFVGNTRAAKAYAYLMLKSFKMLAIYKNVLSDNCVCCRAAFVGHSSSFYRRLFDANHVLIFRPELYMEKEILLSEGKQSVYIHTSLITPSIHNGTMLCIK